jgi:hypothetical protein
MSQRFQQTDIIDALDMVNSLYEEPFFSFGKDAVAVRRSDIAVGARSAPCCRFRGRIPGPAP